MASVALAMTVGCVAEKADPSVNACALGGPLVGASYDLSKSRFAFGSTPTQDTSNAPTLVRWVGKDGVIAIWANGSVLGVPNASSPEAARPDWSNDPAALSAHVLSYFVNMGVQRCEVGSPQVDGGSMGRVIVLPRAVDGITVVESLAHAHMNVDDQSTDEGLWWPTIPAETVSAARALRDRLKNPTAKAAYLAKLPSNAQGDGHVVIHHSSAFSKGPFQSAATYDVLLSDPLGMDATGSFDADGNPVSTSW